MYLAVSAAWAVSIGFYVTLSVQSQHNETFIYLPSPQSGLFRAVSATLSVQSQHNEAFLCICYLYNRSITVHFIFFMHRYLYHRSITGQFLCICYLYHRSITVHFYFYATLSVPSQHNEAFFYVSVICTIAA